MRVAEWLFLAVCCLAYSGQGSAVTENFNDRTTLQLNVNVWLVGEKMSDGYISSELKRSLDSVLPYYLPDEVSEIEFDVIYNVKTKGKRVLETYKGVFQDPSGDDRGTHTVFATSVTAFLDRLLGDKGMMFDDNGDDELMAEVSFDTLPIVAVLPNDILPPHKIYSDEREHCSQTFIGDVLFIDLSAMSCDLSKYAGGGFQLGNSASDVWQSYLSGTTSSRMPQESKIYLLSRLSNIIISSVKKFVVSSVSYRATHSAGKVLCPILFLSSKDAAADGQGSGEDFSHVSLSSKELDFLTSWVESLLQPHQEAHIFSATHYVEDHPQLSLAMAAASRSHPATVVNADSEETSVAEFVFLDSDNLLLELAKTGDTLTQRLLLDAGHGMDDDMLLEVEALFQNFRTGAKEVSKLERWMEETDPHNFARDPKDGLLSNRYTASHERTKIVPVIVLSDAFALESKIDEGAQRIHTRIPLFDQAKLVSCRQNVALVMHSTAYNTHVFEPNLLSHTNSLSGTWTEVDLSDPTLLIAEGLAGSLVGLHSPHIRAERMSTEVDFTWGLGSHPFSPFHHVPRGWKEQMGLPRMSNVLTWATRRAGIVARTNADLYRLYRLLDHGVLFMKDINRVLALLYEMQQDEDYNDISTLKTSEEVNDDEQSTDHSAGGSIEYHNPEIEQFISEIFIYDLHSSGKENGEGLHIKELVENIAQHKVIFHAVLQRILDVKAAVVLACKQHDLLHITDLLSQVENEVHDYRDKIYDNERDIRDIFSRCDFTPKITEAKNSKFRKRISIESNFGKLIGFGVAFLLFVFCMKKIQEKIDARNKKDA